MKVAATEALQVLLDNINETEYKKCLQEFDYIHRIAMEEIKQICPEISKAENRLRTEGINIFREKIVSERKKHNDDNVYRFMLMEYNTWLADSDLCTVLDFSPSQNMWELKNNLMINISELLDFIEYFEENQNCKISVPTKNLPTRIHK